MSHVRDKFSIPYWLRKCSKSSFLPRTPSAFEQARRRALRRSILLGRAAIFGNEEDYCLQDSRLGAAVNLGSGF